MTANKVLTAPRNCRHNVYMTSTTEAQPTQHCTTCKVGPFFHVATRRFPTLCLDCSAHADREVNGWTPENSVN